MFGTGKSHYKSMGLTCFIHFALNSYTPLSPRALTTAIACKLGLRPMQRVCSQRLKHVHNSVARYILNPPPRSLLYIAPVQTLQLHVPQHWSVIGLLVRTVCFLSHVRSTARENVILRTQRNLANRAFIVAVPCLWNFLLDTDFTLTFLSKLKTYILRPYFMTVSYFT